MRRVAVLAVGAFAIGTDTFVVAGILPKVMSDLSITLGQAGQLVTVFAIAFAVCAPVLGAVLGRVPRKGLLLGALLLFAAANVLSALAPTFGVLLGSRVLAAAAAAAYTPAAAATAAGLVAPEKRGRALALVLGGVTAATVLGVPIGAWVGLTFAWRVTFLLVAALAVLSAAALAVLLPALPAPPVLLQGVQARVPVAPLRRSPRGRRTRSAIRPLLLQVPRARNRRCPPPRRGPVRPVTACDRRLPVVLQP